MALNPFQQIVVKKPKRHVYRLTFDNLLTCDFGNLTPIMCKPVYPNEDWRIRPEIMIKTMPLRAPIYSRIDAYVHYFFVPSRVLMDQNTWENFITGGLTGLSLAELPSINSNNLAGQQPGSLADYMNIPTFSVNASGGKLKSALPLLAYKRIYCDYYQDEQLDGIEYVPFVGGEITDSSTIADLLTLRQRAWYKDYFTMSRPDTQLGEEEVIPVTGQVVSSGDPFRFAQANSDSVSNIILRDGYKQEDLTSDYADVGAGQRYAAPIKTNTGGEIQYYADGLALDNAGILVNEFRKTMRLQMLHERDSRGGARLQESMFHHFGVLGKDSRLQRAQYLGGVKVPVVIGEIQQTSAQMIDAGGEEVTPLGTLAGKGTGVSAGKRIKFFSSADHGYVIGILSIMPKTCYMQGLDRMYWNLDRFDYAWPELSNIGEQAIYKGEIYFDNTDTDNGTFGYVPQYSWLRFSPSEVHGEFKSTLLHWHNGRKFNSRPSLNSNFVHLTKDGGYQNMNRIFNVESDEVKGHFICQILNHVRVKRPISKYGIPTI